MVDKDESQNNNMNSEIEMVRNIEDDKIRLIHKKNDQEIENNRISLKLKHLEESRVNLTNTYEKMIYDKNPECIMNLVGKFNKDSIGVNFEKEGVRYRVCINCIKKCFGVDLSQEKYYTKLKLESSELEKCIVLNSSSLSKKNSAKNSKISGEDKLEKEESNKSCFLRDIDKISKYDSLFCDCALFDHNLFEKYDGHTESVIEENKCFLTEFYEAIKVPLFYKIDDTIYCEYCAQYCVYEDNAISIEKIEAYRNKNKNKDKDGGESSRHENKMVDTNIEIIEHDYEYNEKIVCACKHDFKANNYESFIKNILEDNTKNESVISKSISKSVFLKALLENQSIKEYYLDSFIKNLKYSVDNNDYSEKQEYFKLSSNMLDKLCSGIDFKYLCFDNENDSQNSFLNEFTFKMLIAILNNTNDNISYEIFIVKSYILKYYRKLTLESKFASSHIMNYNANQHPILRVLYLKNLNYFFHNMNLTHENIIDIIDPIKTTIVNNIRNMTSKEIAQLELTVLKDKFKDFLKEFLKLLKFICSFRVETSKDFDLFNLIIDNVIEIFDVIKKNEVGIDLEDILISLFDSIQNLCKVIYFNLLDYTYFKKLWMSYDNKVDKKKEFKFPFEDSKTGKNLIKLIFAFKLKNNLFELYEKAPPKRDLNELLFFEEDDYYDSSQTFLNYLTTNSRLGRIETDFVYFFKQDSMFFNNLLKDATDASLKEADNFWCCFKTNDFDSEKDFFFNIFEKEQYNHILKAKIEINILINQIHTHNYNNNFIKNFNSILVGLEKIHKENIIPISYELDASISHINNEESDQKYADKTKNFKYTLFSKQLMLVKFGLLQKIIKLFLSFSSYLTIYNIERSEEIDNIYYRFFNIFDYFIKNNVITAQIFLNVEIIKAILFNEFSVESLKFYMKVMSIFINFNYNVNPDALVTRICELLINVIQQSDIDLSSDKEETKKFELRNKHLLRLRIGTKLISACYQAATKHAKEPLTDTIRSMISLIIQTDTFHLILNDINVLLNYNDSYQSRLTNNEEKLKIFDKSKSVNINITLRSINNDMLNKNRNMSMISSLQEEEALDVGDDHKLHFIKNLISLISKFKSELLQLLIDMDINSSKYTPNLNIHNKNNDAKSLFSSKLSKYSKGSKTSNFNRKRIISDHIAIKKKTMKVYNEVKEEDKKISEEEKQLAKLNNKDLNDPAYQINKVENNFLEEEGDSDDEEQNNQKNHTELNFNIMFIMNLITLPKIPPSFKSTLLTLYNKYSIKYGYIELIRDQLENKEEKNNKKIKLNDKILNGKGIDYDFIIRKESKFIINNLKKFPSYIQNFNNNDNHSELFQYFNKAACQVTFNFLYKLNYYKTKELNYNTIIELEETAIKSKNIMNNNYVGEEMLKKEHENYLSLMKENTNLYSSDDKNTKVLTDIKDFIEDRKAVIEEKIKLFKYSYKFKTKSLQITLLFLENVKAYYKYLESRNLLQNKELTDFVNLDLFNGKIENDLDNDILRISTNKVKVLNGDLLKLMYDYFGLFKFEDKEKKKEQQKEKQTGNDKEKDNIKKNHDQNLIKSFKATNLKYKEMKMDYTKSAYYPIFTSKDYTLEDYKHSIFVKAYFNLVESCKIGQEITNNSFKKNDTNFTSLKDLVSFSNTKILNRLKIFLVFLKQDPIYCQKKLLEIKYEDDKKNEELEEDGESNNQENENEKENIELRSIKEENQDEDKGSEISQPTPNSENDEYEENDKNSYSAVDDDENHLENADQKENDEDLENQVTNANQCLSISLVLKFMTTELIPNLLYKVLVEYANLRVSFNVTEKGNLNFSSYELLEKIFEFLRFLCHKSNQIFQTYLLMHRYKNADFSFSDLMINVNTSILNYINDAIQRKTLLCIFRYHLGNEKYFDRIIKAYSDFRITLVQNALNISTKEFILHKDFDNLVNIHSKAFDSIDGNHDLLSIFSSFFGLINSIIEEYGDDYPDALDMSIIKNIQIYNISKIMRFSIYNYKKGIDNKLQRKVDNPDFTIGNSLSNNSFNEIKELKEGDHKKMLEYYTNHPNSNDYFYIYLQLCANCYIYLNLCVIRFKIEKAKNELNHLHRIKSISINNEEENHHNNKEIQKETTNKEMIFFIEKIVLNIELLLLTEYKNKEIWKDTIINQNLNYLFDAEVLKQNEIKSLMGIEIDEDDDDDEYVEDENQNYMETQDNKNEDEEEPYKNVETLETIKEGETASFTPVKKEKKEKRDNNKNINYNIQIIKQDGEEYFLNRTFFLVHPNSLKISPKIVEWIKNEAPDEYNKKINFLIQKIGVVEDEMKMKCSLNSNSFYEWLYELDFEAIQSISAFLVIVVNVITMWTTKLNFVNGERVISINSWANTSSRIITIINIIICFLAISIYCGFQSYLFLKFKIPRKYGNKRKNKSPWREIYPFVTDKRVFPLLWNLVFGICSLTSDFNSYFYAIQLISVCYLSRIMILAILSVYKRGSQFISSAILALIILLFYAGYSFYHYNLSLNSSEEESGKLCTTYMNCFMSMINNIKAGGGITDSLGMVSYKSKDYWGRIFYDWIYFFLIILLLLNIINGIVVDTFQQDREEDNKHKDNVENCCFICDKKRNEFLLNGIDFNHHTNNEHNLFNYIHFMMKLKISDSGELSTTECMIKSKDLHHQVNFFPKENALSIPLKSTK